MTHATATQRLLGRRQMLRSLRYSCVGYRMFQPWGFESKLHFSLKIWNADKALAWAKVQKVAHGIVRTRGSWHLSVVQKRLHQKLFPEDQHELTNNILKLALQRDVRSRNHYRSDFWRCFSWKKTYWSTVLIAIDFFFAFAIKKLLHFLFKRQGMSISTTFSLLTVEKTLSNHQLPILILPEKVLNMTSPPFKSLYVGPRHPNKTYPKKTRDPGSIHPQPRPGNEVSPVPRSPTRPHHRSSRAPRSPWRRRTTAGDERRGTSAAPAWSSGSGISDSQPNANLEIYKWLTTNGILMYIWDFDDPIKSRNQTKYA